MRRAISQAKAAGASVQVHVEYERGPGHYAGFVIHGGYVERVIEAPYRKQALDAATERANRLCPNRKPS